MSKNNNSNIFHMNRRVLLTGMVASSGLLLPNLGRAAEPEPRKGGVFRVGVEVGRSTDSLNPALFSNPHVNTIGMSMYNCLTEIDPEGQLIGELAEEWSVSPDAKTWRFQLRKGIEFHNGKSLTPQDVIASIGYHRDPAAKSAVFSIANQIAEIAVDGDRGVVVVLNSGNADLAHLLSDYRFSILPEKDGAPDVAAHNGTGAYTLRSYDPGVSAHLEKNKNYWKAGRGHFDEVEVLAILDSSARANALMTGRIDAMNGVDLKTVDLLSSRPGIKVHNVPGPRQRLIPMRCDQAPFTDVNVRLAMKYAIDREAAVKTLLRGYGTVANDQPIGPTYRYYDPTLEQRVYDPDRAKFHLKKAGLSSLNLELHVAESRTGHLPLAEMYEQHARAADIEMQVSPQPSDSFDNVIWKVKPFVMTQSTGRSTEDWIFSTVYAADANWNDAYWKNERFNQLLVQARPERDENRRREMYSEMQRLVRDDGGWVIPFYQNFVCAVNEKIASEPKWSTAVDLDGWRCAERWWSAE